MIAREERPGADDVDLDAQEFREFPAETADVEKADPRSEVHEQVDVRPFTMVATRHRAENADVRRSESGCYGDDRLTMLSQLRPQCAGVNSVRSKSVRHNTTVAPAIPLAPGSSLGTETANMSAGTEDGFLDDQ